MEQTPITLASASPRRRRLLAWLGLPYDVTATDTDEDLTGPLRNVPPVLARSIAADKSRAARAASPDAGLIVACDTIVMLDGEILGKPADEPDALRMLAALSGRTHEVATGVALLPAGESEPRTFAVVTPVLMRELDDGAISTWIAGGEAMGCAGAYNIEAMLASVDEGECYQNVAGLPLCHVYAQLTRLGISAESPVAACDESRGTRCTLGPRICGAPVR
ncbi:MAG: Maf family protein [Coriobacteriia bacterium]|nr:Maf family protein [Coriobacteriia bacterium]